MRRTTLVLLSLIFAGTASAQSGTNLLANGDFTMGLTGYTPSTTPGYVVSTTNECSLVGPSGGITDCAVFGTPGTGVGVGSLSQTIATLPGVMYTASLVTGFKPLAGGFLVFLGAAGEEQTVDCTTGDFCLLTVPFTATSTSTTISLGVRGYVPPGAPPLFQSGTFIADASVIAAVPEPGTMALLGGGLLIVGGWATRRTRLARRPI